MMKFGAVSKSGAEHRCTPLDVKLFLDGPPLLTLAAAHSAMMKVQHLLQPVTPVTTRPATPIPVPSGKSSHSSIGSVEISPATVRTLEKYRVSKESPSSPFAYKTAMGCQLENVHEIDEGRTEDAFIPFA